MGHFTTRDPAGYVDGMSLYQGYFAPGGLDPSGLQLRDDDGPSSGILIYPSNQEIRRINARTTRRLQVVWAVTDPTADPVTFGDNYCYYLTHPSAMDADLRIGFYVSGSVGIASATTATVLAVGPAAIITFVTKELADEALDQTFALITGYGLPVTSLKDLGQYAGKKLFKGGWKGSGVWHATPDVDNAFSTHVITTDDFIKKVPDSCPGSGIVPSSSTRVVNTPETIAPQPVKPNKATDEWEDFLGPGPYTNKHPRTGQPDPDRLVSPDRKRSIRYGSHEMNGKPTKHHYHEENWTYDISTDTMTVDNQIIRVPLPKKK